jgi:hypothetical protein
VRQGWRAAAALLALAGIAAAQEVAEDPSAFPDGPHRDEVFYLCTACHSSRLVRNQALSRERWDATLSWMSERHGMAELVGEERERFLDYLTASFGPRADGKRRSPFLTPPPRANPFAVQEDPDAKP